MGGWLARSGMGNWNLDGMKEEKFEGKKPNPLASQLLIARDGMIPGKSKKGYGSRQI